MHKLVPHHRIARPNQPKKQIKWAPSSKGGGDGAKSGPKTISKSVHVGVAAVAGPAAVGVAGRRIRRVLADPVEREPRVRVRCRDAAVGLAVEGRVGARGVGVTDHACRT